MITKIDEFIARSFKTATEHGFHDEKTSYGHQMMLVVSEIGEAVEADRKCRHSQLAMFERERNTPQAAEHVLKHFQFCFEQFVKDTVEDEMADVCIRLFDMCGYFNVVPYCSKTEIESLRDDWKEAFGDMSFCEQAFCLVNLLCDDDANVTFGTSLAFIYYWSQHHGIDLVRHIKLKMQYNESRGYKHGKKY